MADEETTQILDNSPAESPDEETAKADMEAKIAEALNQMQAPDPEYAEFLTWKKNRAEMTARYGLRAYQPGNAARRLILNRAYRGAKTGEEPIHAGAYFEDDPQLKGLAEFLVEHQFAEWLD